MEKGRGLEVWDWPSLCDCQVNLQERRIATELENLERDTGVKLRVLAQNYPDTPGEHLFVSLVCCCVDVQLD
jgi:hypothetical protein